MPTNDERHQKLERHLSSHLPNLACQLCDNRVFDLSSAMRLLAVNDDESVNFAHGMTLMPISCKNCGGVIFLDAHLLGLIDG